MDTYYIIYGAIIAIIVLVAICQLSTPNSIDYGYGDIASEPVHYGKKSESYYEKQLKTKEWRAKREKILKRDGYKCAYCGSKSKLNVHHKYYNLYPNGKHVNAWDYPDDALITLCESCHKKVHETKPVKVYYRKYSTKFEN